MIFFNSLPPNQYSARFIGELLSAIRTAFNTVVRTDQAVERVMLRSPNGTVYEVTVADDGTLTTAVNDGKGRV